MNEKETAEYIKKVEIAAKKARLKALKLHKTFEVPIVIVRNGKIVEIPADEKLVEASNESV